MSRHRASGQTISRRCFSVAGHLATMLFISQDLPVIRQMCDRVGVMRNGQLLEVAETETLFTDSQHEYTAHLFDLMPKFTGFGAQAAE